MYNSWRAELTRSKVFRDTPPYIALDEITFVTQGSFPVRKRTETLRIWRAREREPIWGSGGGAPSGVQGQSPWSGGQGGKAPLKLKAFTAEESKFVTLI